MLVGHCLLVQRTLDFAFECLRGGDFVYPMMRYLVMHHSELTDVRL